MADCRGVLLAAGAMALACSALAEDALQPHGSMRATASAPALDLTPPDIRQLLPESQWRSPLALPEDEPEPEDTVQVRGTRRTPDIPGGIASVFWALAHPSEAWRIVAPAQ